MNLEVRALQDEGFPDIYYTKRGLHQDPFEVERQLMNKVRKAKEVAEMVLVVYGRKFCYVNTEEPTRTMKTLIAELQPGVVRIKATQCMDMVASEEKRNRIATEIGGGESVWWITPGWVEFRHQVFKGMDKASANENFDRHTGGAIVLDAIVYTGKYMEEKPEEFLDYSDWMGFPIQPYPMTLDRFKALLSEAAEKLNGWGPLCGLRHIKAEKRTTTTKIP